MKDLVPAMQSVGHLLVHTWGIVSAHGSSKDSAAVLFKLTRGGFFLNPLSFSWHVYQAAATRGVWSHVLFNADFSAEGCCCFSARLRPSYPYSYMHSHLGIALCMSASEHLRWTDWVWGAFVYYRKQNTLRHIDGSFPLNPERMQIMKVTICSSPLPRGRDLGVEVGGLLEETWLPGGGGRWWWAGSTDISTPDQPSATTSAHPWDTPGVTSQTSQV